MNTETPQYDTAIESVEMRLFTINQKLERLTRHHKKQERNLEASNITWADAGSLGHIEELLIRVSDFVFQESE